MRRFAFAIVFGACVAIHTTRVAAVEVEQSPSADIAPIEKALIDPGRSDADVARDGRDHPLELLAFFGIREKQVVLDLFGGGGYWSDILGHAVGPDGRVYLHNNAAYLGFAGKSLDERIAAGRLPATVQRLDAEIGALPIAPGSVDVVLMVMTYHDLYFKSEDWSVEPDLFFREIRALMKPGGVLAIVDHAAIHGSGSSAAQPLHRIDEAFARADIEAHGFRFDGALEVLRNPADDRTIQVFDPVIRGMTDRFVHRYVRTAD
jgi:predicted methyltransferase